VADTSRTPSAATGTVVTAGPGTPTTGTPVTSSRDPSSPDATSSSKEKTYNVVDRWKWGLTQFEKGNFPIKSIWFNDHGLRNAWKQNEDKIRSTSSYKLEPGWMEKKLEDFGQSAILNQGWEDKGFRIIHTGVEPSPHNTSVHLIGPSPKNLRNTGRKGERKIGERHINKSFEEFGTLRELLLHFRPADTM